ncbi:hypothetical protein T05_16305 [Trichinella murrelli]|uniref:Uncharacterized protein n=1 Tax=Trichinella murrelli TaxID=144512 RepID=A0A0V0U6B1_9BILA|nr:hypothetical protein T05_16305 [Trichinella murrelli]
MLPFLLPIQINNVPHRHNLHHSETMDCCQKIHIDKGLAIRNSVSRRAGTYASVSDIGVQSSNSLSRSPPFRDNGLLSKNSHKRRVGHQVAAIHTRLRRTDKFSTSQEMILREKFCVTESWDQSDFSEYSRPRSSFRKFPMDMLKYEFAKFQFDEISELDFANSDDSDTNATTVETIPLKTYLELNECVDHLERFIEAAESADKGIHKVISVVR